MFAVAKLMVPATLGGYGLLAAAIPGIATIGALVGIASLMGGALVVGTLRAQLSAAKNIISLSETERRLLSTKTERLERRLVYLESQPNLEQHAELLKGLTELVAEQGELTRAIYVATVPPDHRDPADD